MGYDARSCVVNSYDAAAQTHQGGSPAEHAAAAAAAPAAAAAAATAGAHVSHENSVILNIHQYITNSSILYPLYTVLYCTVYTVQAGVYCMCYLVHKVPGGNSPRVESDLTYE